MKQLILLYIKNPFLYIGFGIVLFLTMYLFKGEGYGFDIFPSKIAQNSVEIGQLHIVEQKFLGDYVVGVVYGSVAYKNNIGSATAGGTVAIEDMKSLLAFVEYLKGLYAVDIGSLVQHTNPAQSISEYLQETERALAKADKISRMLGDRLHLLEMEYRACKSNKDSADTRYARGLSINDGAQADAGYQDAKEYGDCATKIRIELRAYKPIEQKILQYYAALSRRYDFLAQNKGIISSQTDLFEGKKLEEMIEVRDRLQQ